MKRAIVAIVLLVNVFTVFASGDEGVSREAKQSFQKEFPLAEAVTWKEIKEYDLYLVRFVYANKSHVAYVEPGGTIVALARLVEFDNVPFKVGQAINQTYNFSEITKVEELTT